MRVLLDNANDGEYDGKYNYIIKKCLDFNPNYRFQNIEELKNEILNGYILEKEQDKENYSFINKMYYYISYFIVALFIYSIFTYLYLMLVDMIAKISNFIEVCLATGWFISIFVYLYFIPVYIKKIVKYQYVNRNKLRIYVCFIRVIPIIFMVCLYYYYCAYLR